MERIQKDIVKKLTQSGDLTNFKNKLENTNASGNWGVFLMPKNFGNIGEIIF